MGWGCSHVYNIMDGDLELSLGGLKKLLGPNFRMTFLGKKFHLTSENLFF